jgi:type I restriction enzyme, S subunit
MSVPKLRFPEFLDVGEWEERKLGEVADVSKLAGYEFTKHIIYEESGRVIALRGLNIKHNSLDLSDVKYIDNSDLAKLTRSKLFIDDLMFTYIGTIGEVALIKENDRYYLAPNVSRIRANKSKLDSRFLLQFFNIPSFKKNEIAKYISSSSQPALTMGNVRQFTIVIPTLPEQQKIAECLSSIDDRITAETQKLDALKAHKKGLMQQLFPVEDETLPKLRFPEFLNEGEWEIKPLQSICSMQAGKFISASNIFEKGKGGIYPCYGGNGLRGYTKTYTHSGRYSLIGRQGALCGNVNLANGDFYATEHAVVVTPKEDINVNWLFYKLDLLNLNRYATGQAQPGLSVEVLEKVQCIVPTKESEQKKIADCLSSIDEAIAAQSQAIDLLKLHKKGLMQQLFPSVEEVKG